MWLINGSMFSGWFIPLVKCYTAGGPEFTNSVCICKDWPHIITHLISSSRLYLLWLQMLLISPGSVYFPRIKLWLFSMIWVLLMKTIDNCLSVKWRQQISTAVLLLLLIWLFIVKICLYYLGNTICLFIGHLSLYIHFLLYKIK